MKKMALLCSISVLAGVVFNLNQVPPKPKKFSGSLNNILKTMEAKTLIATCGGGSHGSDRDPVGGKKSVSNIVG